MLCFCLSFTLLLSSCSKNDDSNSDPDDSNTNSGITIGGVIPEFRPLTVEEGDISRESLDLALDRYNDLIHEYSNIYTGRWEAHHKALDTLVKEGTVTAYKSAPGIVTLFNEDGRSSSIIYSSSIKYK